MQNYLTISAGKDDEGKERTASYQDRAKAEGKSFSKWARDILDKATEMKITRRLK